MCISPEVFHCMLLTSICHSHNTGNIFKYIFVIKIPSVTYDMLFKMSNKFSHGTLVTVKLNGVYSTARQRGVLQYPPSSTH